MFRNLLKSQKSTVDRLSGLGAALYLRQNLVWLDVKIAHYDVSVDPGRKEYNEHCIFVFWHEYILLAVGHWANTPVTMLVSQHRDANWLTQAAEYLGFNYVRGSTTRGGTQAIRELKKHARNRSIGITPDGPKGPRREMAMGPVFMASLLKMPIVPVGFGYRRPWRLNTWDQFAVPRPMSRARVIMGPKIRIQPKASRDQLEQYSQSIQQLTTDLTGYAEQWAESGQACPDQSAADHGRSGRKIVFRRLSGQKNGKDPYGIQFGQQYASQNRRGAA